MKKLIPLLLLLACAPAFAQKISSLPVGTTPAGSELVPMVQSGATVTTTPLALLTYDWLSLSPGSTGTYCPSWSAVPGTPTFVSCPTGMVWPSGSAGIPSYGGSSAWGGSTYNASNAIPANFLPAALASSTSINGVTIPPTSSTAVTAPTSTTANNCYLTTTTAGLASTGACPGGSSPGGSSYSFQYNNSGALGGVLPGATGLFGLNWSSLTAAPTLTGLGSLATTTPGTGVATALAVNVGTAGAVVVNGGAGGTPSSLTLTNATGLPISTGVSGLGTSVATALGVAVGSAGAVVVNGGALGTPSSGVGTNFTGTASGLNIGGTAGNLSGTPALPNGTTATTQTTGDSTTKLATDAFVIANAGSITGANNTIALNNSGSSGALTPGTPQAAIGVLNSASANAQTGTTYTFVIGDANGEVTMSNGSSNTVTIPPNSSVAFPVGTLLTVQEVSTGVTSVGPGTGVTITSAAYGSSTSQTYSLGGVYGFIQLQQTATNTWTVVSWDTPVGQSLRALAISAEMQAYLAASTQFTYTPTGCTPSAATGGPFSGKITLASGPCTSILITLNGATGFTDTNGYDCTVEDKTLQAAGTWFGRWGVSADTTTTATIPIPSAAGSTDVISFSCVPRSL